MDLQDVGVQRQQLESRTFAEFVERAEPRLRVALIAAYGPGDGEIAALDALSWAWEHWDEVQSMDNAIGYLYRVGQSSARRSRGRPIRIDSSMFRAHGLPEINPDLVPALGRLSTQQRTAVMLVHAFGWPVREVARMLQLAPSTVQTHLERGIDRLRALLGDEHE